MQNISFLYRNLILKYYNVKNNLKVPVDNSYLSCEYFNDFCSDDHIILQIKIVNNIICDFRMKVEGCFICIASANFMLSELINKNISEVIKIINIFIDMLNGKEIDCSILNKDFKIFQVITNIKSRIACSVLPWKALLFLLKNIDKK